MFIKGEKGKGERKMKQIKTLKDFLDGDRFELHNYLNYLFKGQEETAVSQNLIKLWKSSRLVMIAFYFFLFFACEAPRGEALFSWCGEVFL